MAGNRGAGRPKGSKNKRTVSMPAIMEKLNHNPAEHLTTDVLMRVMNIAKRAETAGDYDRALEALKVAADINSKLIPYLHPKLSATELSASNDSNISSITVTWNPPKDDINDQEKSEDEEVDDQQNGS